MDRALAEKIEIEQKDQQRQLQRRKEVKDTAIHVISLPFAYFAKLSSTVQALLIVLVILWLFPAAAKSLIDLLKVVQSVK